MHNFEDFVQRGSQKEFNQDELNVFFGSMYKFIEFITPGIPILAGNITTMMIEESRPFSSHNVGRLILRASTDEFGLNETMPHNLLLVEFAKHFNIDLPDMIHGTYAVPAARHLGYYMKRWYREDPMFGFGVHVASEETGYAEAHGFARVFEPPKYGLEPGSISYTYIGTHVAHEDEHDRDTQHARNMLEYEFGESGKEKIQSGYEAYMERYNKFIHELTEATCG